MTLGEAIAQQPAWLQAWVYWMVVVNLASLVFLWRRTEARWVIGAFLLNGIFMSWLHGATGYTRLLGLSHVIFWTPLLVYLFLRLPAIQARTAYGIWVRVLMATNGISLVVDYVDVVRYLLGERAPLL
jgi:hypothetical protein